MVYLFWASNANGPMIRFAGINHITGHASLFRGLIPRASAGSYDVNCPVHGFPWIVTNPPSKASFRPFSRFRLNAICSC